MNVEYNASHKQHQMEFCNLLNLQPFVLHRALYTFDPNWH